MMSWWNPTCSHVAVKTLVASSSGCFDTAIVIEIRKRVRLRNGYRQKGDSETELEMPDTHRTWTFKKLRRMPFP